MAIVNEQPRRGAALAIRKRLGSMSFGRTKLALEILALYVRVRWIVVRHGAISAVPILRRGLITRAPGGADSAQLVQGVGLGRAVEKVLRRLPFDGRCLMRSLVLTGLLARRGIHAKLVIGVRTEPTFAAHAWVELHGQPLLPSDESTYGRLVEI